jgi:hypothetical protein
VIDIFVLIGVVLLVSLWAYSIIKMRRSNIEAERLKEINDRLIIDALGFVVEKLSFKHGRLDATIKTALGGILADFVKNTLSAHAAPNFAVMTFRCGDGEELFYINIGRCGGDSIEEKYMQACDELAAIKEEK